MCAHSYNNWPREIWYGGTRRTSSKMTHWFHTTVNHFLRWILIFFEREFGGQELSRWPHNVTRGSYIQPFKIHRAPLHIGQGNQACWTKDVPYYVENRRCHEARPLIVFFTISFETIWIFTCAQRNAKSIFLGQSEKLMQYNSEFNWNRGMTGRAFATVSVMINLALYVLQNHGFRVQPVSLLPWLSVETLHQSVNNGSFLDPIIKTLPFLPTLMDSTSSPRAPIKLSGL